LIKIIDRLQDFPEEAPDVWQAMEMGTIGRDPDAGDDSASPFFKAPPKKVGDLEVEWIATFILQVSGGKVSKQQLDAVDGHDDDNLMRLLNAGTSTSPRTPLPAGCHHKGCCTRVFTLRYKQVGNRFDGLADHISPTGEVDWMKWACHTCVWDADTGHLTTIKHISGKEAEVLEGWVITKKFALKDPWLDQGCSMHSRGCEYVLAMAFEQGEGPNEFAMDKKASQLSAWAKRVEGDMQAEEERKAADEGNQEGVILQSHDAKMQEKRRASLAEARKKLAEKKPSRMGLRLE
jgi:hypothetical protein